MPGNAFRTKPFRGGIKRASVKSPGKPNGRQTFVPTPASANGVTSRRVSPPRAMPVRTTTKSRKSVGMPAVRQGAQVGSPGRTGSPR